jgi:6-phosphogluconolactonase
LRNIKIFDTPELLAQSAAEVLIRCADEAKKLRGRFSVALSGGGTPAGLYNLLAEGDYSCRLNWKTIHFFWGDERCVPPNHSESNYRAARESLLDHVPVPAGNIHRIRGELNPCVAAERYEEDLRDFFQTEHTGQSKIPRFDLVLLGMGSDGHTASLFPGKDPVRERNRWVIAYYVDLLKGWRITMTPVLINNALSVIFIVSGQDKAEALKEVLTGAYRPDVLPAQIIRPESGNLQWLADQEGASLLGKYY